MSSYEEAQKLKNELCRLIDERISSNEIVKSCIKAKMAIVTTAANTSVSNKVGVRLIGDEKEIFLPYNSTFTPEQLTVNTKVSVWYYYTIKNGIVMKNSSWTN